MFSFLCDFFKKNNIDCFAPIPLSACKILRPYLLEHAGITDGTAVMLAIPYFTRAAASEDRNLSAYAVSRDYHGFFKQLFDELIPLLQATYPAFRFAGFADHSPIAEADAAARAGLGVIGRNNLLITERYSSYVFLGELVTDARLDCTLSELRYCEDCGACRRACPLNEIGTCLSALTQKKGELSKDEQNTVRKYGSVWGCDLCQEVCPHTKRALKDGSIFSPIPYFSQDTIPHLTAERLDAMSDTEFSSRAYAWRGRDTIARNLKLFQP